MGEKNISRRNFLKTTAVAGAAAATFGVPAFAKAASAAPVRIKMQTVWDAGTVGFDCVKRFAEYTSKITEGKLIIETFPAGAIVGSMEMFDAVKAGVFDAFHCFDCYWPGKMPVATFLSSYAFGMDRPDQWEIWYEVLGGKQFAEKGYGSHNMKFLGPIQHDDNLIHSKVPIRTFEDFKGKKIRYPGGIIADIYKAAGVATILLPGGEVYPALEKGVIDGADFVGPAINYNLGYGEIAKYIIMGPPTMPCLHQPVDIMSMEVNMRSWNRIPKDLQDMLVLAVKWHSWDQYVQIQKANLEAWPKFKAQGVEVIRLPQSEVDKFKPFAIPLWFDWAKRSPEATEAFKTQWEFMKSEKMAYYTDKDLVGLVDRDGKKLAI